MGDVLKSEPVTITRRLEPRRAVNEKFSLCNVVL